MADFPGTLTVSLLSPTSGLNPNQTANIVVTNAPDGLNFNFNAPTSTALTSRLLAVTRLAGPVNIVNVNYGNLAPMPPIARYVLAQNFDFVNVNLNWRCGIHMRSTSTSTASLRSPTPMRRRR